jgi:CDP-glycerol glycerophosphotransferase
MTLDRPRSGATTPQLSARGTLIDVAHYPDVADLLLAADVAVLDDGPLRFDWALTGRPAVFLAPDGNRAAPLVPLDETAPGPVLRRTDEVAAALADPDRLRARHADRLAAYNARFNPLHDGHAAERVVEAFFGGGGNR